MISKDDYSRALEIFRETENNRKHSMKCPACKGHNVELVSTPRKASNWISAVFGFLFASYAMPADQVYHCFNCGHEFENVEETNTSA